jgi:hypothetical protein
MRSYVRFLVMAALALVAFAATMFLQGGWQSAVAAVAILTGAGFLTSFIALLVTGERLASPAQGVARGRALARPAPAAARPREAAPAASKTPERPRTKPRASGRLSSVPS